MEAPRTLLFLLLALCAADTDADINPVVVRAKLGDTMTNEVDADSQIIFEYKVNARQVGAESALRIYAEAESALPDNPLMVVVRHKAGVLSWQLPLEVKTDIGEPWPIQGWPILYNKPHWANQKIL